MDDLAVARDTPVPIPDAASATMTSWPAIAAARYRKPDHARADHKDRISCPAQISTNHRCGRVL
jgi:hypothetical protein